MKLPIKCTIGFVLVMILFILYPMYQDYRDLKDEKKLAPILLEDENDKIVVRGRTVTRISKVRLPDGTVRQKVTRKTGVRKVAVTVKEDGSVHVYDLRSGPTFEPGISIGPGRRSIRVGIDAQAYYWGKWAVGGGVDIRTREWDRLRIHAGVFRDLNIPTFENTSLYCGFNNNLDLTLNVRIRLGGGN